MKSILVILSFLAYASGLPRANNIGRIIGGHDISIEEVPYQISLQENGRHLCGGSIISETHIVTAAHCLEGRKVESLSVRAGTSTRELGGQVVDVNLVHIHPKNDYVNYDIAILELKSSLTFGDAVAPIELPSKGQSWPAGTKVLVTGWGVTEESSLLLPFELQGVTVEIIDTASCMAAYGESYSITDQMLCAGLSEGGKDACSSDSGGPLAVNGILGGIVSFGNGCAQARFPGVYTNVPALRDFIEEVTGL